MAKYFRIPFALSGTKTTVPDTSQVDGTVSYTDGYGAKYGLPISDPDALRIERGKMNDILNDVTDAIRTLQQQGIADWISNADNGGTDYSYAINAIIRYTDGKIYRSKTSSNTSLPTDTTYWVCISDPTAPAQGGTGQSSYTIGDILYASAAAVLSKLAGNITTTRKFLRQVGDGTNSAAPVWDTLTQADVSGVVPSAKGGAGTINGIIKGDGAGLTSQAVAGTDYVAVGAAPANGVQVTECMMVAVSNETTDLTTGTAKLTFRMPYAMLLTSIKASVTTASVGANIIVNVKENGTTILSTLLSIDAGEKTSATAATPPVISDANLGADSEITIDISQVGTTTAGAGLKVYLIGRQT